MSCNYADGLSPYEYKGKLGISEKFDSKEEVEEKIAQLAEWLNNAKHVVVHTGAGISTSAGIPDFRGPNGVWTLEAKGLKPDINISFDDAVPTYTHMAIVKLAEHGKVQYVVSQNIDGLHLRSGLPRLLISELHGNMFIDECNRCERQYVRGNATTSVGQKSHGVSCPMASTEAKRPCRGQLCDTILDWEAHLPEKDLKLAEYHSSVADLSITLGTTLQIVPSGNLPTFTKKYGGRLIICNLQPTKHDKKADLIIHSYVDDIMMQLMNILKLTPAAYDIAKDPTKNLCSNSTYIEWTIQDKWVKAMCGLYESLREKHLSKQKVNQIRKRDRSKSSSGTDNKEDVKKRINNKSNVKITKTESAEVKEENEVYGQNNIYLAHNVETKESSAMHDLENVIKSENST